MGYISHKYERDRQRERERERDKEREREMDTDISKDRCGAAEERVSGPVATQRRTQRCINQGS